MPSAEPDQEIAPVMSDPSASPAATTMPPGPWLLVVGMHRSGTSALTGALGRLGLAVPTAPDRYEYYGRAEGNPEHWESRALGIQDDALLERLGSSWDGPPDPDAFTRSESELALADLADPTLAANVAFPEVGPLAWKDPRVCLLLPYWLAHLPKPIAAVFIWRSPLSVARSLLMRNGIPVADGVALWERYNRSGLAGLVGVDTFVTKFETTVEDAAGTLGAIATWLGELPQFAPYAPRWDVEGAAASISPELHHQHAAVSSQLLLREQSDLQRHLEALGGPHRPLTSPAPGGESPWTTAVLRDRRQAASLQREIADLNRARVVPDTDAEARAAEAARQVDTARARIEGLSAEIQRLDAETMGLQGELATLRELHERMRTSKSWRITRPLRQIAAFKFRRGGAPTA
jgi:hypothetical protein